MNKSTEALKISEVLTTGRYLCGCNGMPQAGYMCGKVIGMKYCSSQNDCQFKKQELRNDTLEVTDND